MREEVNFITEVVQANSWGRSNVADLKLNLKRFLRDNPDALVAIQSRAVDAFEIALAATDQDYKWSMVSPPASARVFSIVA